MFPAYSDEELGRVRLPSHLRYLEHQLIVHEWGDAVLPH